MQIKILGAKGGRYYNPAGMQSIFIPENSMFIIEGEEAEKLIKSDSWNSIKLNHKVEIVNKNFQEKIDIEAKIEAEESEINEDNKPKKGRRK